MIKKISSKRLAEGQEIFEIEKGYQLLCNDTNDYNLPEIISFYYEKIGKDYLIQSEYAEACIPSNLEILDNS